jgi:hypothetical protein
MGCRFPEPSQRQVILVHSFLATPFFMPREKLDPCRLSCHFLDVLAIKSTNNGSGRLIES